MMSSVSYPITPAPTSVSRDFYQTSPGLCSQRSQPSSGKTLLACGTTFVIMELAVSGTGSAFRADRAEVWRHHVQSRVSFVVDHVSDATDPVRRPDVRTPAEHVENIRRVFNPPMAELAKLFDVSRQAVYKWMSGESAPESEKLDRIAELSRIADAFVKADVSRAGSLLNMKTFEGRSLLDLIRSGENRPEHVSALIAESRAMEVSYRQSGLASSKAKPTSDWQATISIPGNLEQLD